MKKSALSSSRIGVAKISRSLGRLVVLTIAGLASLASVQATVSNYRPVISPVPDQHMSTSNTDPVDLPFTVTDHDGGNLFVTASMSNSTWGSNPTVTITPQNGTDQNRTCTVSNFPSGVGAVTVTLVVTDTGGLKSGTSFTLNRYTGNGAASAPELAGVPNKTIQVNHDYGPILFTSSINDGQANIHYTFGGFSSNTNLVQQTGIDIDTSQNPHNTITITPVTNATNKSSTITITITKDNGTSNDFNTTSFVVDAASNNPPILNRSTSGPTFVATTPNVSPTPFPLSVTAGGVGLGDILLSAISSNSAVVPNSSSSFQFNNTGTSSPSVSLTTAANKGATTITVTATDGTYASRTQFLYVVRDPADGWTKFGRSSGVFLLDGSDSTVDDYNPFGYDDPISLRDNNMVDPADISTLPFVDGYVLRVPWTSIENSFQADDYDFFIIDNALNKLGTNQKLSVIIQGEPFYIDDAADHEVPKMSWEDPSITHGDPTRAVPWYQYMRDRWDTLMDQMGQHTVVDHNVTYTLAKDPRLAFLNPSLPGAQNGIRDPIPDTSFATLPGYTRADLLAAIEDYLTGMQNHLPGKLVQIGFWDLTDDGLGGLTDYLQTNLVGFFDGQIRPRVGFWEENLAASRTTAQPDYVPLDESTTPYRGSPPTAGPLDASKEDTWVGFQMLGSWTAPFNEKHLDNTLNGHPNDAFEFSYNQYHNHYCETYNSDVNSDDFKPTLQSWHDYLGTLTPVDVPVNLDFTPNSTSIAHVTWDPVYGATSYELQRKSISVGTNWQTVGTVNAPTTYIDDTTFPSTGDFAYQVRAINGLTNSDYSQPVAVFRSTASYDGIVRFSGAPINNSGAGGISAGEGPSSNQAKGILSFVTSEFGSGLTFVSAKLALKQSSNNDAFTALNACQADVKTGNFSNDPNLNSGDFNNGEDDAAVATIVGVGPDAWSVALLNEAGVGDINPSGNTQFRLYFGGSTQSNKLAGWYPGEDSNKQPDLIVQYTTP